MPSGDFQKIGVLGLGLIGGSMAPAAKKADCTVFGLDRDSQVMDKAGAIGIRPMTEEVLPQLDVLLTALYPGATLKEMERLAPHLSQSTLVIDLCEAMTVIDVNTAKFTGKRELEDTVLRLNLEACGEIARQVRLRNLSGIIIIDMIDMKTPEHRQMVLDALEEAFASDRVKTVIHGLTSLGLVEMTRKRSRPPLREMLAKQEEAHE